MVTLSVFVLNINRNTAWKTSNSILPTNLGYENLCVRILRREFLKHAGEEDAGKEIKYHVTKKVFLKVCLLSLTGFQVLKE